MRRQSLTLGIAAFLALLLVPAAAPRVEPAQQVPAITDPTAQVARSPYGMVASMSTFAAEAGARILAEGGNAVDAAVATSFALAVAEPAMSGLGGRASIVIRTPAGEVVGIDGLNQVPSSYRSGGPDGYERAAIPGVPAAVLKAHAEHGSLPRAQVLAPAIRLAEEGYRLPPLEASRLRSARNTLLQFEGSRQYFLKPDGSAYEAGEIFVQRDLARVLRGIAEGGAEAFYRGWIAERIHEDMVAKGGFITRDELAGYEALPAVLARGSYRGLDVVGNYRPASTHAVIASLQIMEQFPRERLQDPVHWAAIAGQAMQLGMGSRGGAVERVTSREFAVEQAGRIRPPWGDPGLWRQREFGESLLIGLGNGRPAPASGRAFEREPAASAELQLALHPDDRHTTHLVTADRSGGVVALTQSLGPSMGTGVAAPGLGFLYATRLGSAPGSRPASTISPTLLLRGGQPVGALGSAGDARIMSSVIQVISRMIDHGMPLDQALAAPRLHPASLTRFDVERGEYGWSEQQRAQLEALGFELSLSAGTAFGRVHALTISTDVQGTEFLGVAEPRAFGGAAAPLRLP